MPAAISATAQTTAQSQDAAYTTGRHKPGTLAGIDDSSAVKPGYLNDINISAARDFVKRFSSAASPRWLKLEDGSFFVRFEEQDARCRAAYNKRGRWLYTIRSYNEKQLPRAVRHIVKSTYYDFAITGVDELTQYDINGPVYMVYLAGDSSYITVQVNNGEMQEAQELYKGNKH